MTPLKQHTVCIEIDREAREGKALPTNHLPAALDIDSPGTLRRRLGFGRITNCVPPVLVLSPWHTQRDRQKAFVRGLG